MANKSMIDALSEYGDKSSAGLKRMGKAYRDAIRSAHPKIHEAGELAVTLMPGVGALEGMRLGSQAGQQWRDGRYGRSLGTMADALDTTMDEIFWAIPGIGRLAGRVPK